MYPEVMGDCNYDVIQEQDPVDGNCGTEDLEGETAKAVEGKGGLNKQVCLTGGYINALEAGDASFSNISKQKLRELAIEAGKKEGIHSQFHHMLKCLSDEPTKYKREEFKYLREFVSHVGTHR